jgi:hypothetical protein
MALPLGAASKLAADMAKKGISGSISMGEPKNAAEKKHMGSGDMMDESPEKEDADPMMSLAGDMLEAFKADDKTGLADLLKELCQRASEDHEKDDMPADDSY